MNVFHSARKRSEESEQWMVFLLSQLIPFTASSVPVTASMATHAFVTLVHCFKVQLCRNLILKNVVVTGVRGGTNTCDVCACNFHLPAV